MQLIGPFKQIVTMDGPEIIKDGGIVVDQSKILAVDSFEKLRNKGYRWHEIAYPAVAMPGLIDAHTHICFAGSRYKDYASRLQGLTYQEIAAKGGGILDTVQKTRAASQAELESLLIQRTQSLLKHGVTTCEVKSGYGLSVADEIKILKAIKEGSKKQPVQLIPTCLAAHVKPPEFNTATDYLNALITNLLPILIKEKLTKRIDIFVDACAFSVEEARPFLKKAKEMGFSLCIHADQFTRGGAQLAAELHAVSADHLEASTEDDLISLKKGGVIPIILPGASLGLGIPFGPARSILDHGLPLVLASDWNPGSAPMGLLLLQAAAIGAAQHLTIAETLAAITVRAAAALELNDRGILKPNMRADIIAFPCENYQEILYHQGAMLPTFVAIGGTVYVQ